MQTSQLLSLIDTFPSCRVAVVGDLMLDRYVWGNASRISEEAPVPVVKVTRSTDTPGGAANVASNVSGLGGRSDVLGTCGEDDMALALKRLLHDQGANTVGIIDLPQRRTTVKTRVIANRQQVVRIDNEDTAPPPDDAVQALRERLKSLIQNKQVQAVIFEDYAKGLLESDFIQDTVDCCRRQGVLTALDPHPSHPFGIRGLSLMTPNRAEAFALAGQYFRPGILPIEDDKPLLDVGAKLRADWTIEHLLITLGPHGMALFSGDDDVVHIPTRAREVFDVSGAGDTVTASFVLALAAGASPLAAAHLSNIAAGIVVGKVGTQPVQVEELREVLRAESTKSRLSRS